MSTDEQAAQDVSVVLFEHEDCQGGHVRIPGPGQFDRLDNFTFEDVPNRRQEVPARSVALRVAEAWTIVCSKEGLEGRRRYFGPWMTCRNLNGIDMGNKINSLRIWSTRASSDLPGNSFGEPLPCWIQFPPDLQSLRGLRFEEPVAIPRFVEYSGYSPFQGVSTGPEAWAELFPEENFGGEPLRFDPDTVIPDLSPFYVNDKGKSVYTPSKPSFKSLRLYAQEPAGWPGSSVLSHKLVEMQTSLRSAAINHKLRNTALAITKKIPYVGGGLGAVFSTLWPDPTQPRKVWDLMRRTIEDLIEDILRKAAADDLQRKLDGLGNLLEDYSAEVGYSAKRGAKLDGLIGHLNVMEPDFADPKMPEATLTYFVQMATIMLAAQCERYISYDKLFPEQEASQREKQKENYLRILKEKIDRYKAEAENGQKNALAWRQGRIESKKSRTGGNCVLDRYTGEESVAVPAERSTADQVLKAQQLRVKNEYNAQLADFLDIALLWPYFDPKAEKAPQRVSAEALSGPFGGIEGYNRKPFMDESGGRPITRIRIWAGTLVNGLEVFYGGTSAGVHGVADGPNRVDVTLDAGEVIAGAYGRAGEAIDKLVFRTDKGREFGAGGKGGAPWSAGRPHLTAHLGKVSGLAIEKRSLEALTLYWTYERYQ